MRNNVCSEIFFDIRRCFYMFKQQNKTKNQNVNNFMYKIHGKLWGDDQLICILISTVQEMFHWKLWIFSSFFWINLNLDRVSPLTCHPTNIQYILGELFPYYSANVIYCKLEINQRANTLIKFSIIGQGVYL